MQVLCLFFLALASAILPVTSNLGRCPQEQPLHYDDFSDPPVISRPRFRYWLPDASVDPDVVAADIASVASIGGGGIELVPYFEYGGDSILGEMPAGADWVTYNFGTPPFQKLFQAALQAHHDNGLVMDFALGPNQGQGVPATPDDVGLQWDLIPFTSAVPPNGSFKETVPGWGTGDLVAVVSALVLSEKNMSYPARAADGFGMVNVTYMQHILQAESLTDHTNEVNMTSGHVSLSFSEAEKDRGGKYDRLFSFYQKQTLAKNLHFKPPLNASDAIFRNGSYIVDHFSAKGAETVARFWEEYILTDGLKKLLKKVGNYVWEDSVEVLSNMSWSPSLPARYEQMFGESINLSLPLLAFKQNNIGLQSLHPGSFQCLLDTEDHGSRYVNNFRQVLAGGYADYLQALRNWSSRTLDLKLSVQPAYNLPVDMSAIIPDVDVPECESLGFSDDIDSYRLFAGAANLAGKRVISNEIGAVLLMAYRYTLPSLLFSVHRAFAGGINQFVLHGQSYTGKYYGTTWPGHTAFGYIFSELWSEKQPSWHHGLGDIMKYIGRVSHMQQTAIPKWDVVKYKKDSATTIAPMNKSLDLVEHGWSYTYISPDNFKIKSLYVKDGTLAPDGPAWKAFLIEASENLTTHATCMLGAYAKAGLPVILAGGVPGWYPVANETRAEFQLEISRLLELPNVFEAELGGVADQLAALDVAPRVAVTSNGTWYATWSELDGIGYAFVLADLVLSTGNITVLSTGTPYYYDAWTGERRPVLEYTKHDGMTVIPLHLAGNQTVIIAFTDGILSDVPTPEYHVTSTPPSVIGSDVTLDSSVVLHVAHSDSLGQATLSCGRNISIDGASVPGAYILTDWTLIAEHWEAPEELSDVSTIAIKRNTTHHLHHLQSWDQLPKLTNVSGIGYYKTTFIWPPTGAERSALNPILGAYLNIGRVLHAATIQINGRRTTPLDPLSATKDISPYLRHGENELVITTPTTMWNYLQTMLHKISTAGKPPILVDIPYSPVENGLVGPVTVTPFQKILCSDICKG
ncbi:hypothetical protein FOBRF1_013462 [Fusarium oxysporum]